MEWDYRIYEGGRTDDIRSETSLWSVWTHPIGGGESVDDVGDGVDRFVEVTLAVDGPVVVFAHGHVFRILVARWIGLPPTAGALLHLDSATVSTPG